MPQTRSTSSASCLPSTQIRLAWATRARVRATRTDPDADRGTPAAAQLDRADERDRIAVDQERRRPKREHPDPTPSILKLHRIAFAMEHRATEATRGILHDQAYLGRQPWYLPPPGWLAQHVRSITHAGTR